MFPRCHSCLRASSKCWPLPFPSFPWNPAELRLFPNAEGRENPAEQIVRRELAGDFRQALLGLSELLGHQFAGASFEELALSFV